MGRLAIAVIALAGIVLLARPAAGQGAVATVSATVTLRSTCLIASPGSVGFGIVSFSQQGAAPQTVTAPIALNNCSPTAVTVLARGSQATGNQATWNLAAPGVSVCTPPTSGSGANGGISGGLPGSGGSTQGINTFIQGVRDASGVEKQLTTTDQTFKTVAAGATEPVTLTFVPPCAGSSGGGQSMTFQYIFTATAGP
jgi:hypothetical protein